MSDRDDTRYQVVTTRTVVERMTADGFTVREIARMLNISRQTVHYHLSRIGGAS